MRSTFSDAAGRLDSFPAVALGRGFSSLAPMLPPVASSTPFADLAAGLGRAFHPIPALGAMTTWTPRLRSAS